MKILVAGGAGFIGVNLCKRLSPLAETLVVLDNFSTARLENRVLLEDIGVELMEFDITTRWEDYLSSGIADTPWDLIINLACPASPVDFVPKAIDILRVCSVGVFNLLELALRHRAVFIQASTSECYGDPLVSPQNEDYWGNVNPVGMRSCYDEGKRFAESAVINYHRRYGLKVRIARIFNTYGPYMRVDDGRVISNFIVQALQGRPLTVYGDGSQDRSFCYIDDLVEAIIKLIFVEYPYPLNIGNPENIRIVDLARLIIELTASRSIIEYKPLPPDDPKRRCPDIERAKKLLDWQPKTRLESGLINTINYFKKLVL